jgi:hypothetical protein
MFTFDRRLRKEPKKLTLGVIIFQIVDTIVFLILLPFV